MTIKFEIYSDKEMDRTLVSRYWAQNEEDKFAEKLSELLPFDEIKNISQLVSYINKISKVWDERVQCFKYAEAYQRTFPSILKLFE